MVTIEMLKLAPKKRLKQGFLIAIEGIDGAGKTTQSRLLGQKLHVGGYSVLGLHEPTDGKWGKRIREIATNGRHSVSPEEEMELFYLDRLENVERNIAPALEDKKIVILDRYYLSNVAYQSARGLNPEMIEQKNLKVAPKPNIVVILDLEPEVALTRIREKRNSVPNHFEKRKYLEKVRSNFIDQFQGRLNVKIMDGDDKRTIDTIASDIFNFVKPMLKQIEEQ